MNFKISQKRKQLKSLMVTYKLLCIQRENWWEEVMQKLEVDIAKTVKRKEFEEMQTEILNYMMSRDGVS